MDDEEENWKIVDGRKGRGIKERDFNTAAYRTYKIIQDRKATIYMHAKKESAFTFWCFQRALRRERGKWR